jgi:hypothetical protein
VGFTLKERVEMKRLFLGLLTAALVAFGAGQASASTINVDPNPTDHFNVGNSYPGGGAVNDSYQFTLSHAADLSDSITVNNISAFTLQLFDPSNAPVSLSSDLAANILYTLKITGTALAGGIYAGQVNFSAVPVPPALLLFATALVGLGAVGYRRRGSTLAA